MFGFAMTIAQDITGIIITGVPSIEILLPWPKAPIISPIRTARLSRAVPASVREAKVSAAKKMRRGVVT